MAVWMWLCHPLEEIGHDQIVLILCVHRLSADHRFNVMKLCIVLFIDQCVFLFIMMGKLCFGAQKESYFAKFF